ncbi:MAG: MurT ligase domain-containing protein [Candidatus Nomurabacteria bacterium]|jgi:UDP-N-acetylmuramyl tripeptide synthase|nr:MurT ligase domain-containing protein [Candidatus Nomurabacteria bacterium]
MKKTTIILGKLVRAASRLRGGGSALPGLVVEKVDPSFLSEVLSRLPFGVAVVSGTNGKTTTTKMVTELLESQGLRVFTNRTGSNFTRGVISAILGEMRGFKFNFDIAVLELDEAHAVRFVKQIKPKYALLLNVFRDQLDRFGEIDKTAKLLTEVAKNTTSAVILNKEDPLIAAIACSLPRAVKVKFFGYSQKLSKYFPNDDELLGKAKLKKSVVKPEVELTDFNDQKVFYSIEHKSYSTSMKITGAHNLFNAAGALALTQAILSKKTDIEKLLKTLSQMQAAFGRGEVLLIDGKKIELILVKNPSGFRLSLLSQYSRDADTMIAINDQYADGRDMSWLWDVDFSKLKSVEVVTGIRAYDMALRLKYDDVEFTDVETDVNKALGKFLSHDPNKPKQIFCTYTAMLQIRKLLSKLDKVERAL